MSEMGELFQAWGKQKQEKRASNRATSATMLDKAGAIYEVKNGGAHLIVQADGYVIDFWPGTGLWITRGFRLTLKGRGVRNLINHLQEQP